MRALAAPVIAFVVCGYVAAGGWRAAPSAPAVKLEADEGALSAEDCSRLASYRTALLSANVREAGREALLGQLRRVPPVAWVEGYWATPVDLSALISGAGGPGEGERGADSVMPEAVERGSLPPPGVVFTSGSLRATVALPFVGALAWLESEAAARQGVFVVPATAADEALIEYLPPPPAGDEDPCYFFCGDPAAWDFDGDGEPNADDPDDDGDGVADERDAYPYWQGASECECGGHSFVGFTQKSSSAVTAQVLAAYEVLERGQDPLRLGSAGADAADVWFMLPDQKACPPAALACPDPADRLVRYFSRDPEECARLRFFCPNGGEPFSNECGCGCEHVE